MSRAPWILLPSLLLAGCSLGEPAAPLPWEEAVRADPELSRIADEEPYAFRLAVAPVSAERDELRARYADDPTRRGSLPDREVFRRGVVEALRRGRLFSKVEARAASPEELSLATWQRQDDLVLELVVTDHHQEYRGHVNYVWWLFVYTGGVFPAFWIPVDVYGAGLEVQATLRGVQAGQAPLLEKSYRVRPDETEQELTPRNRNLVGLLDVSALWSVEESLEDSNWKAIEELVAPHAWRRFQEALLRDIAAALRPLRGGDAGGREQVLARVRKRFAVVAGVSEFADDTLPSCAYALEDARAVASTWSSPAGGEMEAGRELTLLTNEQATREGFLAAIAEVASRAAISDEVLIYASCLGVTFPRVESAPLPAGAALGGGAGLAWMAGGGPGEPALLLHDARAADLDGSALSLRELGRALDAIPAERVLLVLDASFAPGAGATARTLPGGGAVSPWSVDLRRALGARPGRSLLLAAAPDQAAQVLSGARAGLFTQVFTRGIAGEADADEDGRVGLDELEAYVRRSVRGRAGLEGFAQDPWLLVGARGGELGWPR